MTDDQRMKIVRYWADLRVVSKNSVRYSGPTESLTTFQRPDDTFVTLS
jgi:hypothetical protein